MKRLVWLLLLNTTLVFAATDGERLVQKLNAIHTLQADFKENMVTDARKISQTKGRMAVHRPGRLRWQSLSPVSQLVLADGKQVWIYDVELEQVTIKPQAKALQGTPALFLSDSSDELLKDYEVQSKGLSGQEEVFELQPYTKRSAFSHMTFSFRGELLQSMKLVDHLGQKTTIIFSHVKQNITIPLSQFKINLPRGVDVIRE